MTFVVAQAFGNRVLIAADTRLTGPGGSTRRNEGVVKTCFLSPTVCLSFSQSPELAEETIRAFHETYPVVPERKLIEEFFLQGSRRTGNEYILAFHGFPVMTKISAGNLTRSREIWIGDRDAYVAFLQYKKKRRTNYRLPTWQANILGAADVHRIKIDPSAFDVLINPFLNLITDPEIASVGDFYTIASNSPTEFRFLHGSTLYFDGISSLVGPKGEQLMVATGENSVYRYSLCSPEDAGVTAAAFFFPQGGLAYVYYGMRGCLANEVKLIRAQTAEELNSQCRTELGIGFEVVEARHM
jgi:hypothetical protein